MLKRGITPMVGTTASGLTGLGFSMITVSECYHLRRLTALSVPTRSSDIGPVTS